MKRIPLFVTILVTLFLILCVYVENYGVGIDRPEDWDTNPQWWQSDYLAQGGFFFRLCAIMPWTLFGRSLDNWNQALVSTLLESSVLAAIILVAVLAFFTTKFCLILFRSRAVRTGDDKNRTHD